MAPSKPLKSLELVIDNFGNMHTDKGLIPIKRFTWRNQNRVQVQLITYGATITSIKFPNKKGIIDDVVLGFDDMQGYLDNPEYYFGVVGRFVNHIKNGFFMIGKKEFKLSRNMGGNHYNGGSRSFDKEVWEYNTMGNKVVLSHVSPDNDEGYPGVLMVFATYELTHNNEFKIEIRAFSNKPTICNISNSIHFNLAGHGMGPEEMAKHELVINADCMICTNEQLIPTGEIRAVYGTIYDFQVPVKLASILDKYEGLNTNLCVNRGVDQDNCFIARLTHPDSGRILEIYSNQYGFQLETGNNFPLKMQVETPPKPKNPYFKNGLVTFELLDEIYNRVSEVLSEDKLNKYNDLLKLIKDLQKKENTLYRSSSSVSVNRAEKSQNSIKRSRVSFDNINSINLTSLQVKYIEKIVDKMDTMSEPKGLQEVKDILENVLNKQRPREDMFMRSYSFEKNEEFFEKELRGKRGAKYVRHCALNLKTLNYPDSINHTNFPNCILKPGGTYTHTVTYRFYVKSSNVGCTGYI